MIRVARISALGLLAAAFTAGCGEDSATLVLQARSDMTPGTEVAAFRTVLRSENEVFAEVRQSVAATDRLSAGLRILELDNLSTGTYSATISALGPGEEVLIERPLRVTLEPGVNVATVLFTRNCLDVMCPLDGDDPTALACVGGRCVEEGCTEETPELCGEPECAVPADCATAASSCVQTECTPSGTCLAEPIGEMCATIVGLDAGAHHTCVVRASGDVLCWGRGSGGRLGDGGGEDLATPTVVIGIADAAEVVAGRLSTCALHTTGEVSCWGRRLDRTGDALMPERVPGLADVTSLDIGRRHACAVHADGHVSCWGENAVGQLGRGMTSEPAGPADVVGIDDAVQVTTGDDYSCVIHRSGGVSCWGDDEGAQLARGVEVTQDANPGPVVLIEDAVDVVGGTHHACVLRSDGAALCWGSNHRDELNHNAAGTVERAPLVTDDPGPWLGLGAGRDHSCGITTDGVVRCWGSDADLQVPNDGQRASTSVDVELPAAATEVALGDQHTCALLVDGSVYCWGADDRGQRGDGQAARRTRPVEIDSIDNARAIAAGGDHTCVLDETDAVLCFGKNHYAQLGSHGTHARRSPTLVASSFASLPAQLALGNDHSCARLESGTISCWGRGGGDRLGNGSFETRPTPGAVNDITDALYVAANDNHTCAVMGDGTLRCWGDNTHGQLGISPTDEPRYPVQVPSLNSVDKVATGHSHTCAIAAGQVFCWGDNEGGQLGDGTLTGRSAPAPVTGILSPTDVACGEDVSCAVDAERALYCWGSNRFGQVGDGSGEDQLRPILVADEVDEVHSYAASVCYRSGGRVFCFGLNEWGEVGIGSRGNSVPRPAEVAPITDAAGLAVGEDHACALHGGGRVSCWGSDVFGQLGLGVESTAPTRVMLE